MRALTATVRVLLHPSLIGPDAAGQWGGELAASAACDYVSAVLSDAERETILDWRYEGEPDGVETPTGPTYWHVVEVADPATYEEGDAFAEPLPHYDGGSPVERTPEPTPTCPAQRGGLNT